MVNCNYERHQLLCSIIAYPKNQLIILFNYVLDNLKYFLISLLLWGHYHNCGYFWEHILINVIIYGIW